MKALIDRFWAKYSQLQLAVRSGDGTLIDILDGEITPLLDDIYESRAGNAADAKMQFQFVLELLRKDADDVSNVLRQSGILQSLADRYFFMAENGPSTVSSSQSLHLLRKNMRDEGFLNEAILDCLPDRVAVITTDYRYLYSNPRNAERLDERPVDLIGRHIVEFIGIQRFETRAKPNLDRCFAGENVDYTFSKQNGDTTTVVRCRMNPCLSSTGKPIGAILILQELADRRRSIAA